MIWEENGKVFVEISKERFGLLNPVKLDQLEHGVEIFVDAIWPAYDAGLTAVIDVQGFFLKKPNLVDVSMYDAGTVQRRILREARVCEEIKKMPHPALVNYKGCLVNDGKIKGLVLEKYKEDLYDRVKRPFDLTRILQDIKNGIEHLHSIGYIHGDISPANIMFDADDKTVIIDFDCARALGEAISDGDKQGTKFFTRAATLAEKENDYYSITCVQSFMEKAVAELSELARYGLSLNIFYSVVIN